VTFVAVLGIDLCIHVLRRRDRALLARFEAAATGLCISAITLMELPKGGERSPQRDHSLVEAEAFAARLSVLPFDAAAASAAAIAAAMAAGQTIGPFDTLIAGHARSLGLVVVTGNGRGFGRVAGLASEDWAGA
jgi:tRNA(fMet)-specific endonuclease VapC